MITVRMGRRGFCEWSYPGSVMNRTSMGVAVLSFRGVKPKLKLGGGKVRTHIGFLRVPAASKEDRRQCVTIRLWLFPTGSLGKGKSWLRTGFQPVRWDWHRLGI